MDLKQKEITRTLQVLLWLWFGTITSFAIVNMTNIAKLETQMKNCTHQIQDLEKRHLLLKYNTIQK
jgi:hypothetical protein